MSCAFRLANLCHTATVAACVSDAIASEIIEAGVVADGGMNERSVMWSRARLERETRPH